MATQYNQPIVIDNGSGSVKAGFAGDDTPKVVELLLVGRNKYMRIMAGGSDPESGHYIGENAQEKRGLLSLSHPVSHGIVTNWEDMDLVWSHCYSMGLRSLPQDHPLLITEAPLNPRLNRAKMAQLLFEQYNIPCLYVLVQAVLALYASGRTTGVVLDVGDGVSHVVPVYEGFSLPQSIRRLDIAGRDITEQLQYNLRRIQGLSLSSSSEMEIVRLMKEKFCFVSLDVAKDERAYRTYGDSQSSSLYGTYRLPDGHQVTLGPERFRLSEILFQPHLIGDENGGIHMQVNTAISKVDLDLRPALYQNLVLLGGSTLLRGFGDRLLLELKQLQEGSYATRMKIKIYAPPERKFSTWIGGSILAGLLTFSRMWVTLEEYRENPDLMHLRCM